MEELRTSRTGITGLVKTTEKEMAIFTHAKKLAEYIVVITEKSPKKFRWNIVSRLQNVALEVVDKLYFANLENGEKRMEFQKSATVALQLVQFYAEIAKKMQAISLHQLDVIATQTQECRKLLFGWVRSTKK